MGLKSETRTVNGMELRSTQLPALRAMALGAKLGKILAPSIGKLAGLSLKSDVEDFLPFTGELLERLAAGELESLLKEVLAATTVTIDEGRGARLVALNNAEAINAVFAGKLRELLAAALFALEVNFSDFFNGAPNDSSGNGASGAAAPEGQETSG